MPTLSEQILDQMNIEALTKELQTRSLARNAARKQLQAEPSSLASSIVDLQDTRSDTSTSFDEVNASSSMSHSVLQSWVESSGSHSPALSIADSSAASSTSESMISASNVNNENLSVNDSGVVCSFFWFLQ
jgi:peroxin-3